MSRPRHVPQRSCVACRTVRAKWELMRIVRTPLGEVQLDLTGKLAGRGAYLCRDEACLAQAVRQKKLGRALGVSLEPALVDQIRKQLSASRQQEATGRQGAR
jgi:predicted RNA-binding protein YlxR (DUF448 family)